MQMKKNKVLLLGGTVLFSVMGGIEKANSAEIQNEINIINKEKPIVINNTEENKAPRMDENVNNIENPVNIDIQKRVKEVLGDGDDFEDPKDSKERVVFNPCDTDEKKQEGILLNIEYVERGVQNVKTANHAITDVLEGQTVEKEYIDPGMEPYCKPYTPNKNESNEEDKKENDKKKKTKTTNEIEFTKMYEQETGQKVTDSVKQMQNEILSKYTVETKKPMDANDVEQAKSVTWYGKVFNKVKHGLNYVWTSIKTGWSKVKSIFKWK